MGGFEAEAMGMLKHARRHLGHAAELARQWPFGARAVVAISAPTALAVERARMHGVTLVALARNERALVFNGGEHVRVEASA
jgi:hypothetical protein